MDMVPPRITVHHDCVNDVPCRQCLDFRFDLIEVAAEAKKEPVDAPDRAGSVEPPSESRNIFDRDNTDLAFTDLLASRRFS